MIPETRRRMAGAGARALWSVGGALTGMTLCWMAWGLATPGDYFGNGSPWLWLSVFASGVAGGYAAFATRSKPFRVALVVVGVACAIFWLAVPTGWWATPPPKGSIPPGAIR